MEELQKARDEALAAHALAAQRMSERITRKFTPFKVGEKVWLDARNLKTGLTKKLAPKKEGPFEITEVKNPLVYQLKIPDRWKIHPVFHATLLSRYVTTQAHGPSFSEPPPETIDGEQEWEVEAITDHKKAGRGYRFLVKWKGYPLAENKWLPGSSLVNAGDILEAYKRKKKLRQLLINYLTSQPQLQ